MLRTRQPKTKVVQYRCKFETAVLLVEVYGNLRPRPRGAATSRRENKEHFDRHPQSYMRRLSHNTGIDSSKLCTGLTHNHAHTHTHTHTHAHTTLKRTDLFYGLTVTYMHGYRDQLLMVHCYNHCLVKT